MSFITNGFLVLVFTIFLLAGRAPGEVRVGIYREIDDKIRRYLVTKVTTSAATGILVGIILGILGLDLAFVFGVPFVLAILFSYLVGPIVDWMQVKPKMH